ncbi:MAG: BLUF domain-containing protein, partial [Chthoniobacterales bacterium]
MLRCGVFFLVYMSTSTRRLDEVQLMDILTVSRATNAAIEVTGLLLYKGGSFMQMIEGEEGTVRELFEKIVRDPRHYNVVTLLEGVHKARVFPDCAMGFQHLDGAAVRDVPGFTSFQDVRLSER